MPKRSRKQKPKPRRPVKRRTPERTSDPNLSAFAVLQEVIRATEGTGKDPVAVMLGRRGGLKGGRARAEKLTNEQRRESAIKAARSRWDQRSDH